jgi:hypothetical protein
MGLRGVVLSRALFGAAAVLWLTAVFLPPVSEGSGASLSSHRLADLLASGLLAASAPPWLGLLWYAMPIGAALTLMALGLGGWSGALLRIGAATVATVSALTVGAVVSNLEVGRLGSGLWCAVIGSVFAVFACGLEIALSGRGGNAGVL